MGKLESTLLDRFRRGDSWVGITVGPVLVDGVAPASAIASVKMQFRDKNGTLGYEFNDDPATGEGTVTIDAAATWEISVLKQALPLTVTAGKKSQNWYWDIEITDEAGAVLTVAAGKIVVDSDITYG
jgi:hypothetical protein